MKYIRNEITIYPLVFYTSFDIGDVSDWHRSSSLTIIATNFVDLKDKVAFKNPLFRLQKYRKLFFKKCVPFLII